MSRNGEKIGEAYAPKQITAPHSITKGTKNAPRLVICRHVWDRDEGLEIDVGRE